MGFACCTPSSEELPVVATGRYVEIATEREETVCAGTVDYFDRVIASGFELLGETPPERVFVRFEWLELEEPNPAIGGGHAERTDEGVLLQSDVQLVEEHELAHAVHLQAWPTSNTFLHEGLAVLLDPKRVFAQNPWPDSVEIDEVLEASSLTTQRYALAWFLVSQIVDDHGFEGLAAFWRAVPRGSTAAEVRAAYQQLFGRSIDALIEPRLVENEAGTFEVPRFPCNFALCLAPAHPWDGNRWEGPGPLDCGSDPSAIGPDHREYLHEYGDVWRDYVIEMDDHALDVSSSDSVGGNLSTCSLVCSNSQIESGQSIGPSAVEDGQTWPGAGRHRVEVRSAISDLPTAEPGELVFRRSAQ